MPNQERATVIAERLEFLRDTNQLSVEMARRAGLPKRSMDNYFKGQKPGYDALIAIADAFRVPIDWLAGRRELDKGQIEEIVRVAARHELLFLLESMMKKEADGAPLFTDAKVAGHTSLEDYADRVAGDIMRRTSFLVDYYPDTSRRTFKDDAL